MADLDSGQVSSDAEVVAMLTGAGWKDLARFTAEALQLTAVDVDHAGASIDEWARSVT